MKKTLLFSVFIFSMQGLSAIEASSSSSSSEGISPIITGLPPELDVMITEFLPQEPFPIDPHDAIEDVGAYYHSSQINFLFWVGNRYIASGGADKKIKLVDSHTGKRVTQFPYSGRKVPVSLAPNGDKFAWAEYSGKLHIVDIKTGEEKRHEFPARLSSVAWSTKNQIALGDDERTVMIINADTGELEDRYHHYGAIQSVAWSPDGTKLASGAADGKVKIADLETKEVKDIHEHRAWVHSVAWSQDGTKLVLSRSDGEVRVFDRDTHKVLFGCHVYSCFNYSSHLIPISLSPDAQMIALANDTGNILIVDTNSKADKMILSEYTHTQEGSSVSWSPDGMMLASGDKGGTVKVKSVVPLLLARYHPQKSNTLAEYVCIEKLLVQSLKQKLLKEKKPLFIGKSGRDILERMPDLKKLLKIEKSLSKTENPIWRITLKQQKDFTVHSLGFLDRLFTLQWVKRV